MMERTLKILAIKFKYLGDVVLATPALRALKQHWPESELHVLVPQEAAPVLAHIPWITKVWSYPRNRGRAQLQETWPLLNALRKEKFERSVDFVGNDRGAITSLICGARHRLGVIAPEGFWGRRLCYNQRISEAPLDLHESKRDAHVLSAWEVPQPDTWALELRANPSILEKIRYLVPSSAVICHVTASQPKKQWPQEHWGRLNTALAAHGVKPLFTAGQTEREQVFLEELQKHGIEQDQCCPCLKSLDELIALLAQARLVVSVDTAPLHIAAGLSVPTIALFGPSRATQFAPIGAEHDAIVAPNCRCSVHAHVCTTQPTCMSTVWPEVVLDLILSKLNVIGVSNG